MTLSPIALAYETAGRAHAGQRRRGNGEPYINHPIRVARMVADRGASQDVVVAAVLHDVVEDSDVTIGEIRDLFGPRVAELVGGVTDDPSIENLPRRKRKTAQAEKYRTAEAEVCLVKLADQNDNLDSLLGTLDSRKAEDALSYADCAIMVVRACGRADGALLARAERTYGEIIEALSIREDSPVPA